MDQANFLARGSGGTVLTLAGRSWRVVDLDWPRRQAHVEPAGDGGRTRWWGGAPGLGFKLCRAMLEAAISEDVPRFLSNRGKAGLRELRKEFAWARPGTSCLLPKAPGGGAAWWTFAGVRANAALANHLRRLSGPPVTAASLTITWDADLRTAAEEAATASKLGDDSTDWEWSEEAEAALKFAELLPAKLRRLILTARIRDIEALQRISDERTCLVSLAVAADRP